MPAELYVQIVAHKYELPTQLDVHGWSSASLVSIAFQVSSITFLAAA